MNKKNRLMTAIGCLIAIGFLMTSLASFFVSRASLRHEITSSSLPLTGDNIYSEIQRDLLQPIFISSLMATDTFVRDWLIQGEKKPEKLIKYLKAIQVKYKTVTSFLVSEESKNYYHFDSILKTVSPDEPRDAWYFRVSRMKEDYEINVDPDLANQDAMTIFINYRIYDYAHRYIGATGVGLAVNAVNRLIESYQEKYNRTIYFIDKTGAITLSGSKFDPSVKSIFQLGYASTLAEPLGTDFQQSFAYTKEGQTIDVNIRYIKEFKWHLVVEQPENETLYHIFKTLVVNLLICAGVLLIILILVHYSVSSFQEKIDTLCGIVPICSYCKQIRDDKGYWNRVEAYITEHTEARFSHSICPACIEKYHPEEFEYIKKKKEKKRITDNTDC